MAEVYEALLCWRLTTDTGTILELWELNTGEFELLTAEAHKPSEIVGAVTLALVEAELLSEKLTLATSALRDSNPAKKRDIRTSEEEMRDWNAHIEETWLADDESSPAKERP